MARLAFPPDEGEPSSTVNHHEHIESLTVTTIWEGRTTGGTWFHPRACLIPGGDSPTVLMTCQQIGGSDVFGPVHESSSPDLGLNWTDPEPVPGLGRHTLPNGMNEGVCDVVPGYHAPTGTVLAIGHNVYYRDNVLTQPNADRYPLYAVRNPDATWSPRRQLPWPGSKQPSIYTCGCAQRLNLPDGRILIPMTVSRDPDQPRSVCSGIYRFDGSECHAESLGNFLHLDIGRGLMEPSIIQWNERTCMTMRAEDDHGYVSVSDDGLHWRNLIPWCWEDGTPLTMSTTQQHWLTHGSDLYLAYTRKASANADVLRWRAPIYLARVDPETMRLVRETETIVLPLIGDPVDDPDRVALMGNFHPLQISARESWITVGENLRHSWNGNTLLARIRWK